MLKLNKTVALVSVILFTLVATSNVSPETKVKEVPGMLENIKWLGHASILIKNQKIIYIDPWQIKKDSPEADLILITHEHYDHCSASDVARLQKAETVIVAPADCAKKLKGQIKMIKPNEKLELAGVSLETVPAYNLNKSFHPKTNNWVGYIITVGGVRIYHTGDSDFIPEMNKVKADIIFVPVGGTYTMDASEAAKMVNTIKPAVAVPIHFGSIVGNLKDAQSFQAQAKVEVKILQPSN